MSAPAVDPSAVATRDAVLVITDGPERTRAFAAALAAAARRGDRLHLTGPLGAGKTQFAKGFAAGLGIAAVVNSPSFTLMGEYEGRLPLFHLDLYRLGGAEEVMAGGLIDERQGSGVTLIEWAERLGPAGEGERLEVAFGLRHGDQRTLALRAVGRSHERYLEAARTWQPR